MNGSVKLKRGREEVGKYSFGLKNYSRMPFKSIMKYS